MRLKNILIAPLLFFVISCTNSNNDGYETSDINAWNLSDGEEFPKMRPLSRAEDGVMLDDGTLIVADQRYGLAKISIDGKVEPFGNFGDLDYSHNPPSNESGPNGVHLTPDKQYILTADVFNGKIYKSSLRNNSTEIAYSHEFGVNTARQDSSGTIWFTQSTKNKNEERLFGALNQVIPDGALYRITNLNKEFPQVEVIVDKLNFANGFYIDEKRKKFYLSEMMSNRVLVFDFDLATGSLSNQATLAIIPTPDNMEMNNDGNLWVASPLSNQILSIDLENGEVEVVFDAQTELGLKNMEIAVNRMAEGGGFADLLTPELTGDMPGLLTGMIIGDDSQPFYVANLGAALIRVRK